ncbi:OLC1v1023765C1 [Oldenlandia corymbosa var. corymbosa]|uniref:OLC1v1023765C1 n=1 Tax=Oldenlandia corymbosa var. corymbosa TaxID=529605 RepID=A0AAV1C0X6_OLDCO|nr:OLC1v1023765C1 [Oldenlandia corymbosa var. corymbosa]
MVLPVELECDEDYDHVMDVVISKCGEFGDLVNLVIPRLIGNPYDDRVLAKARVGMVFVEYEDVKTVTRAREGLNGRIFYKISEGIPVVANFCPKYQFSRGNYGAKLIC